MTATKNFLRSFSAGELSVLMRPRKDDARFQQGLAKCRNNIPGPTGAVQDRPGFAFCAFQKDSTRRARQIPFEFQVDQTIDIEFGHNYLRFFSEGQALLYMRTRLVTGFDAAADTFSFATPHGLLENDRIRVIEVTGSGAVPTGVDETVSYFTHVVDSQTISLSTTTANGSPVALSGTMTGTVRVIFSSDVPHQHVVSRTGCSANTATDIIDVGTAHNLIAGDPIYFVGTGNSHGITDGTRYFAIIASSTTLKVATTLDNALAFAAIDLTGANFNPFTMHFDYQPGDTVWFRGAGKGFFYAIKARPELNVPPAATDFWYEMPDDGRYEIPSDYDENEIFDVQHSQLNDTVRLTHKNHKPRSLNRVGATRWTITDIELPNAPTPPTGLSSTSSPGVVFNITAVNSGSGTVPDFTLQAGAALLEGDTFQLSVTTAGIPGGVIYVVRTVPATNRITFGNLDGTALTTSGTTLPAGAYVVPVDPTTQLTNEYTVTAVTADGRESVQATSAGLPDTEVVTNNLHAKGAWNKITFFPPVGAAFCRVYKAVNGLFGLLGEVDVVTPLTTHSFTDDNSIEIDLSVTLPTVDNSLVNEHPATSCDFDQRVVFASTNSFPKDVWMTVVGTLDDLTSHFPPQATDRIYMRTQVTGAILHVVAMQQLLLLTTSGVFRVNPLDSDVLTPTSVAVRPQSHVGSSRVQPLIVNNTLIFAAFRGGHVHELSFSQNAGGFVPGDLSIRASHLFDGFTIVDCTQSASPINILWFTSSNGKLLGFTMIPEEGVGGWHQHDTQGTFESVSAIPEGVEDHSYVTVKRTLNGVVKRCTERSAPQLYDDPNDRLSFDCGATYDGRRSIYESNPSITPGAITVTVSGGLTWGPSDTLTLTTGVPMFLLNNIGETTLKMHLTAADGTVCKLSIVSVTSPTIAVVTTDKVIPADLRATPTTSWGLARSLVPGFDHLEGVEVSVVADGVHIGKRTVSAGAISIPTAAVVVHAGLDYQPEIVTLPPVLQIDGFGEGRPLNVNRVYIAVSKSKSFDVSAVQPDEKIETSVPAVGEGATAETIEVLTDPQWTGGGQLSIRRKDPVPSTILSLTIETVPGG